MTFLLVTSQQLCRMKSRTFKEEFMMPTLFEIPSWYSNGECSKCFIGVTAGPMHVQHKQRSLLLTREEGEEHTEDEHDHCAGKRCASHARRSERRIRDSIGRATEAAREGEIKRGVEGKEDSHQHCQPLAPIKQSAKFHPSSAKA